MKKFVLILVVSVFLVLPFKVEAAEVQMGFETSFVSDSEGSVLPIIMPSYTNAGKIDGHIIVDDYNNFIVKFGLNNRVVYMKKDVLPVELQHEWTNSGFAINKINPDTNEVIWHIDYSSNEFLNIRKFLYSYSDNKIDGYIFWMSANTSNLDIDNVDYILKYDLDGKLIWKKKYRNSDYTRYSKGASGDLIKYSIYRGEHGILYIDVTNTTQNKNIFNENFYNQSEANLVANGEDTIVFLSSEGTNAKYTKFFRFNKSGEKIVEKEILPTVHFTSSITYKNILNNYDGIFIGAYDSNFNNYVMRIDYNGNLMWENVIFYTPTMITESYDENDSFNGYVVTGNQDNRIYITKFIYQKQIIESKNNDVEVSEDAYPGTTFTLSPKEKPGYYVKRIIVRDKLGTEIEVSDDYTFIMPNTDVTIEVVYEKRETETIINPDTASTISIVLVIAAIILVGTVAVRSHNYLEK